MTNRILSAGLSIPILLCALLPPALSRGEVTYAGSSTILASILYEGAIAGFEKKTGLHIRMADPQAGSGKGMEMVLRGEITVAGVSREIKPEEVRQGAVGNLIGYDALGIWVNAENPIEKISLAQVGEILQGIIRNWKGLGGSPEAIIVFIQPPDAQRATFEILKDRVLKGRPLGEGFNTTIINTRDQIVAVSNEKNGLCVASVGVLGTISPSIAKRVKVLSLDGVAPSQATVASGAYPLARPLYLVTMGKPAGETAAFIEYMRGKEGQEIVGRNFLPIARPPRAAAPGKAVAR